ncbi:2-oxo-tetronate isomerase [Chloroflexota bacterium]
MPKFSANLSMLFKEVDFLDRFEKAAKFGFKGVEFLFPYEWDKEELLERIKKNNLEMVLFDFPPGQWGAGERGLACLPDRVGEFQDGVALAVDYANVLGCGRLTLLAGIPTVTESDAKKFETLVSNVRFGAEEAGKVGAKLMLEALNSQDVPGFCLSGTRQVLDVLRAANHPNAYMQYDIYHMQIMEGNLTKTISQNLERIGHMQLADVPGRHEPGTGEINYENLFKAIDEMGYKGWIGCEYNPTGATEDSLGWVAKYL